MGCFVTSSQMWPVFPLWYRIQRCIFKQSELREAYGGGNPSADNASAQWTLGSLLPFSVAVARVNCLLPGDEGQRSALWQKQNKATGLAAVWPEEVHLMKWEKCSQGTRKRCCSRPGQTWPQHSTKEVSSRRALLVLIMPTSLTLNDFFFPFVNTVKGLQITIGMNHATMLTPIKNCSYKICDSLLDVDTVSC